MTTLHEAAQQALDEAFVSACKEALAPMSHAGIFRHFFNKGAEAALAQQPVEATDDLADYLAGAFSISKGHAYDLMRNALAQQGEPVAYMWFPPKKPELAKLEFQKEPPASLKGLGYVSRPLVFGCAAAPAAQPVRGEKVKNAKDAIMGAAYDFRDAHISGSTNLKANAHNALSLAVDEALAAPSTPQPDARKVIEQMVGALDAASDSIGSFTMDHGSSQQDFDNQDTVLAAIQAGQQWLEENK